METKIRKGRNGVEAQTYIDIPGSATRKLSIHTSKSSRKGISTFASVAEHKDGLMSFVMFQDFSKIVIDEPLRCTEANVRAQHTAVLNSVPDILQLVAAHYTEERNERLQKIRG